MSEATQWKTVKEAMRRLHPVRVDNSAGAGTPDVNFGCTVNGDLLQGWIELKWERHWPMFPQAPLKVDHFTPQQRLWLRKRCKLGGVALLLLQVGNEWLLFDGRVAARFLGESSKQELEEHALFVWYGGLKSGELIECLRKICHLKNDCSWSDLDSENRSEMPQFGTG